jgi:WD40-like Beta Propeller Repeat
MSRGLAFAALVAGCVLLAAGYVGWSAQRDSDESSSTTGSASVTDVTQGNRILFQNVIRERDYARIASVPVAKPGKTREVSGMVCERVHYAAGHGFCLRPRRNVLAPSYKAILLDAALRPQREVSLPGINNRARVSPDGRYAAATGFVTGDSYADKSFSTRTFIVDMSRGKVLANLEDYDVYRDGERIRSIDFNFWGVTFAHNSNRFYATLGTRGTTFLVRGDIPKKRIDVVRENVECPSLSPDNKRLAFKKRVGRGEWRLSVLDLRTLNETPLAETRSVDDQAEWLDNGNVLYGLDASIWVVPANGRGSPRELIPDALSPAVVRS